jgi:hypothetical protein
LKGKYWSMRLGWIRKCFKENKKLEDAEND